MKTKKFICFYEIPGDVDKSISCKVLDSHDYSLAVRYFDAWCYESCYLPIAVIDADHRKAVAYCINFD